MDAFKKFSKIPHWKESPVIITQKINGANGQIYIYEEDGERKMKVGCRSRWITPEDDNHGFAAFCRDNEKEIIEKLGLGRHYGEWAGPRINTGEGLKENIFFLFNIARWGNSVLPLKMTVVPLLYPRREEDTLTISDAIDLCIRRLRELGSHAVEGYKFPEGIVIKIGDSFYKYVFDESEIAWKKPRVPRAKHIAPDIEHLLQPLRLQKILSSDERYLREWPFSISELAPAYIQDLIDENQVSADDAVTRKAINKKLYFFIKPIISETKYKKTLTPALWTETQE